MKLKELYKSLKRQISLNKQLKIIEKDKIKPTNTFVVSLTSIPSRINVVHLTILSLLTQSCPPKKIVLWLNESMLGTVPKKLLCLQGEIFQICHSPHTFSHKKLIHTLEKFSENVIITCDDDLMYDKDFLKSMFRAHKKYPNAIIANQHRPIVYDNNHNLSTYRLWRGDHSDKYYSFSLLGIGAGGILYPKNSLSSKVQNIELIKKLAPTADDLWFKAMSLLKGTETIGNSHPPKRPIPIIGTQRVSLKKRNISKDHNKNQWQKLDEYFNFSKKSLR